MKLYDTVIGGVMLLLIVSSCDYYDNRGLKLWSEKGPQIVFSEYIQDSLSVLDVRSGNDKPHCIDIMFIANHNIFDFPFSGSSIRDKAICSFRSDMMNHTKTTVTAYYAITVVAGKPIFISNVSLFGEIPGSDLSDYLYVPNNEQNYYSVLLSYPDLTPSYDNQIVKPSSVEEYFFPGRMLSLSQIAFKEKPTTGESSAIITVEIPVEDTNYLNAFDENGNFDESKVTKRTRTLIGRTTVKF